MIRLRTLGEATVWGEDGRVITPILAKPKSFALLVYLAAHSERDFHQRESLTSVFWADAERSRARNALRQSIHVLRGCLPEGVVIGTGRSLIGLHSGRLDCDVLALRRAVEAGSLEKAASLYRGDFLDGFVVEGAPEFNRWADAQRQRLRHVALAAIRSLALSGEEQGCVDSSVRWWRRYLELSPFNEPAATGLIAALSCSNHHTEAVQWCESFVSRRETELGRPPSEKFFREIEHVTRDSSPGTPWLKGA